jgi:hypothetical protein
VRSKSTLKHGCRLSETYRDQKPLNRGNAHAILATSKTNPGAGKHPTQSQHGVSVD